jgi:hypothetical protein
MLHAISRQHAAPAKRELAELCAAFLVGVFGGQLVERWGGGGRAGA